LINLYQTTYSLFLLFFGLSSISQTLRNLPNSNPALVGPARVLNWFSESHVFVTEVIFIVATIILILNVAKTSRSLRCFSAISYSLVVFLCFSYRGSIFHSQHIWLVSSFFMILIEPSARLSDPPNLRWLRVIQALCLSHYFFSGFWKLVSLLRQPSVDFFHRGVLEHFAYAKAEGQAQGMSLMTWLFENVPYSLSLGMLGVLVFQLSTLYPIFTFKSLKTYGLLAIVFHVLVLLSLGISFNATIAGVGFFLIFSEQILALEGREGASIT
jgi:hypothetical protein